MTLHMLQTVQIAVPHKSMTTLMHRKTQTNIPKQTVSTYSFTVHCQPTISLQHHVPPCLQCHDVPNSLSLSTPVPNCQANHHASGLSLKVTSQCKHPSSSTVPAHYRTSGVQHFIHVATKPRSLTKQTRPSRFSCRTFLSFMATKPDPPRIIPGSHANLSQLCGN